MITANKLILIIDDEEDIRFTIREICSLAGWNTVTAGDGEEGLRVYRSKSPDIVLVDHHMPKLDGLNTVKRIRKIDSITPILVLTVDESQSLADAYLEAGATDFALKPIKAPDLIARIKVNLKIGEMQREAAGGHKDIFIDKGINNATLQIIVNCLQDRSHALPIEEICKQVKLAYPTVHRYLQHMVESGIAGVEIFYGSANKRGRPKNLYCLKK